MVSCVASPRHFYQSPDSGYTPAVDGSLSNTVPSEPEALLGDLYRTLEGTSGYHYLHLDVGRAVQWDLPASGRGFFFIGFLIRASRRMDCVIFFFFLELVWAEFGLITVALRKEGRTQALFGPG